MSSKTEQAISVVQFYLKKKEKRVESLTKRSSLTEEQKIFIGDETELIKNVKVLIESIRIERERNFGKIPPQATDLEEAIIGAILIEKDAFKKICLFLKPEHFYWERHQIIYASAMKIAEIDLSTIVIQLRKEGKLEAVGGAYELAKLTSKVSQATNIEAHARIIIEFAIKRKLIETAGDILEEAYRDETDCFEILEMADKKVSEIQSWIK